MNCHEIDALLDASAPGSLSPRQQHAVDEHLATCCECRDAWAAFRALAALDVPATPTDLRARVAAAVPAGAAGTRLARRSIVTVGLLVAGVAVAAVTVAVRWEAGAPAAGNAVDADGGAAIRAPRGPGAAGPTGDAAGQAEPAARPFELLDRIDSPDGAAAARPAVEGAGARYSLDPLTVVVLAVPDPASDTQVPDYFVACVDEVVPALGAVQGLNVIVGPRVSALAASGLFATEVARELGAGHALVLSPGPREAMERVAARRAEMGLTSRVGSCRGQLLDASSGAVRSTRAQGDPEWTVEAWQNLAVGIADGVRATLLEDPAAQIVAARSRVLDTTLDDAERTSVSALGRLRAGPTFEDPTAPSNPDGTSARAQAPLIVLEEHRDPIPGVFDDAVVAAVVQIGLASERRRAREAAWRGLRGVRDPNAAQALIASLANDPDESVRRAAALALGYLVHGPGVHGPGVDEPGVRDALTRATRQDPSEVAPVPCCIPSVRGAAARALMTDDELRTALREVVVDETLSAEDRLRPLHQSIDGRAFPLVLDDRSAEAVFAIGSGSADPVVRARAWRGLSDYSNPAFTPVLLADLSSHAADDVRAAAAAALAPYAAEPDVRAALEAALADAWFEVRLAARASLESGN